MPSSNRFPVYRRLLWLYPRAHREKYGAEMLETLSSMLDDAPGPWSRLRVWLRASFELPLSVTRAQCHSAGVATFAETSPYVRRSGVVATFAVVPFFAALAANGLDKVIGNHTLHHSWLWTTPVLGTWALWLPAAGLALASSGYVLHSAHLIAQRQGSWVHRLFDLKRAWPSMIPAAVAAGILFLLFFHDSTHCWVQNPVDFVTRAHQTWSCTTRGLLGGK